MPLSSDIFITDTSCLILLNKIDELSLLNKLSKSVLITPEIQREFGKKLPNWIQIRTPKDDHYQKILQMDLVPGEASVIALTLEIENSILLIDDLKARKISERLNLKYSGTFGLILRAKQEGIIKHIRPVLDKVSNTDFRFSDKLFGIILEQAGE